MIAITRCRTRYRWEAAAATPTPAPPTYRSTPTNQHLLVFVKGDAKKAATYAKGLDQ